MIDKLSLQTSDILRTLNWTVRRCMAWWLNEFRVLFPKSALFDQSKPRSVLIADPNSSFVSWKFTSNLHDIEVNHPFEFQAQTELSQWLLELDTTRERTQIGLALSEELFFVREFDVPNAAIAALDRILEQELVHRTPFEPADVWHGGTIASHTSETKRVRHLIIRKEIAQAIMQQIQLPVSLIDFLAVRNAAKQDVAWISLGKKTQDEPRWVARVISFLSGLASLVLVAGIALVVNIQSRTADQREAELLTLGQTIGQSRAGGVNQFLLRKSTGHSVSAVWNELSRLLPGDAYLNELVIDDKTIILAGAARDAPGLVKILGGSQMLEKVALSGAVVPMPGEGKDLFRISATMKRHGLDLKNDGGL